MIFIAKELTVPWERWTSNQVVTKNVTTEVNTGRNANTKEGNLTQTGGGKLSSLLEDTTLGMSNEARKRKESRTSQEQHVIRQKITDCLNLLLEVKKLPVNAGDVRDTGSIPGSGRSPGGGHDNLHRVAQSQIGLKRLGRQKNKTKQKPACPGLLFIICS